MGEFVRARFWLTRGHRRPISRIVLPVALAYLVLGCALVRVNASPLVVVGGAHASSSERAAGASPSSGCETTCGRAFGVLAASVGDGARPAGQPLRQPATNGEAATPTGSVRFDVSLVLVPLALVISAVAAALGWHFGTRHI